MRSLLTLFLLLTSQVLLGAGAVTEYRLDNGLKLLVKQDHRAPVVVSQVWYKVGASYEHDGISGVSHVLEHMMFKGTDDHPPGEFSRIISENGGSENAFTSKDYTAYFQRLEKSRLAVSFELEADRMRNLHLQDKEFQKEINVVMEERRLRTEDKPTALTYEQFIASAFVSSSVRIPTIGWMDDLENMDLDDLQHWYQRWYAPNNAIVVVVGDVEPEEVLALAKKYFGPLKPEQIVPPKPRLEPAQKGKRYIIVQAPAEVPYTIMGYKVPVLKTANESWEPYALEVLANILDGGDSARLTREIVRGSQIASSAGAGYDLYDRQAGLFLLDATPADSHSIDDVQQALFAQIQRLKDKPVTSDELERIKTSVVASNVYEQDSSFYQAMKVGQLEAVGLDWKLADSYVENIKAVTAEQVQAVASKYLLDRYLTIAELDPLPMEKGGKPGAAANGGGHGH
ncbi:MAG: insulinase family protein [Gammaproteobacteria bacterium]|nr:insulinase family protein [Gammaproteobacteria bacterium]MDH3985606.1 insulinase family protein [Gammaproteobacteria bacterium]